MRYTYSSNLGCLIAILVMLFMFSFIGVVTRFVFTTPVGIALLIAAGVWYIMRSRQGIGKESDFESKDSTVDWQASEPEEGNGPTKPPTRDAEDVDFKEIDD